MIRGLRQAWGRSNYLRDVLWQLSGNTLAQLVAVLAMPVLTRLYMPASFGMLNLFVQVVTAMSIVLSFRLEYLVMLPKTDVEAQVLVRLIGWTGAAIAIPLAAGAWWFAPVLAQMLGNDALAAWLPLAPLTAWFLSMSVALQQAVQRRQDFRNGGLSEVINKGGYVGSAMLGTTMASVHAGLMLSTLAGLVAKTLWLWRSLGQFDTLAQLSRSAAAQLLKEHGRMATAMTYSNLVAMVTSAAPMIYVAKSYGATALGNYGLVTATLYLPSGILGNAIGQVYYQRAAHARAHGQPIGTLWRTTAWQLARIGIPLYTLIALLSPWSYPLIFGPQWADAGLFASAMAVAAGLSFVSSPLDRTCLVVNAWWYQPVWHSFRAATTLAVLFVSMHYDFSMWQFLLCLVTQMSTLYIVDWIAGAFFSRPHAPMNVVDV